MIDVPDTTYGLWIRTAELVESRDTASVEVSVRACVERAGLNYWTETQRLSLVRTGSRWTLDGMTFIGIADGFCDPQVPARETRMRARSIGPAHPPPCR